MRTKLLAITTLLVITATTGCQPLDENQPTAQQKKDWFGNSTADPVENNDKCAARAVAAPTPTPLIGRPDTVRDDEFWQRVTFEVRAYQTIQSGTNGAYLQDVCVPVAIHLYADFDPRASGNIGGRSVRQGGPYDAITVTPWVDAYMVFAYDPQTIPSGYVPHYTISLKATYLRERDVLNSQAPDTFTCAMKINGATVARGFSTNLSDLRGGYTECFLDGSTYNKPLG